MPLPALHDAAKHGDIEKMKRLVNEGADVNKRDGNGWTPLHHAANAGCVEAASWLLQHGARVEVEDKYGSTPLHHATGQGHRGVVEALLQHGARVEVKDWRGWTPLHNASRQGHHGVVEALLQAGADPRTADTGRQTPLHTACMGGDTQCVQLLSQADRGVTDVTDNAGNTGLHDAITWKHKEVVQLLLQAGADVHIQNKQGKSPLMLLQEDPRRWSGILSSLHTNPGRQQVAAPSTSHKTLNITPVTQARGVPHPVGQEQTHAAAPSTLHENLNVRPVPKAMVVTSSPGPELQQAVAPSILHRKQNFTAAAQPSSASSSTGQERQKSGRTGQPAGFKLPKEVDINARTILSQQDDEHVYPMRRRPRGRCIIVNNETYKDQSLNRKGSGKDALALKELFQWLDFQTESWDNYSSKDLLQNITAERCREDHENSDAYVMCILSHGHKGSILCTDSKPVYIKDDIIDQFNGRRCPALAGKPKIFILQACQGAKRTRGVEVADIAEEDEDMEMTLEGIAGMNIAADASFLVTDRPKVHEMADLLIAYSTVSGHVSWRDTEKGTWFVQDFVQICKERAHIDHLGDILTMVNNRVSQRKTGEGELQMSSYVAQLRKKLFLFPV